MTLLTNGLRSIFLTALLLSGIGTVVTYSLATPAIAAAEQPCEDDECELGQVCIDNPGGSTGCNVTGPGSCKTYGC